MHRPTRLRWLRMMGWIAVKQTWDGQPSRLLVRELKGHTAQVKAGTSAPVAKNVFRGIPSFCPLCEAGQPPAVFYFPPFFFVLFCGMWWCLEGCCSVYLLPVHLPVCRHSRPVLSTDLSLFCLERREPSARELGSSACLCVYLLLTISLVMVPGMGTAHTR